MLMDKFSVAEISEMATTPQGRRELQQEMELATDIAKLLGRVLQAYKPASETDGADR